MAEAADILESAAHFLKLGAKKLWLDYDEEADVLYISFRRPQKATDSRMEGDLIYHYRDDELVGITILHAKSHHMTSAQSPPGAQAPGSANKGD